MSNSVQNLLTEHLGVILTDVSEDIVAYLSGMKSEEDFDEFMEDIVDKDNKHHITACEFIRRTLFPKKSSAQRLRAGADRNRPPDTTSPSPSQQQKNKGKKKFQDIHAYKQKTKEKTGRQPCDCEGQLHDFMNNCLNCGRIHCTEEGPGPCFFCDEPIALMGEDMMNKKQKQAMRHKENKVFDDDNDYFKFNEKNESANPKRNRVIALDFASRRVIESSEEDDRIRKKLLGDAMVHLKNVEKMFDKMQQSSEITALAKTQNDLLDLLIQMRHKKPVGVERLDDKNDDTMPIIQYETRIFDEDLMASSDHGLCLSLHQPYASLLVAGVKRHEGRTWPTNHRGRLWIAAAAKEADEEEIVDLEEFYRRYYDDPGLKIPKKYPTGCLLGCVFVEDCLDQETYRREYPNGESGSPFVLICSNPVILPIFYPIVGQHKIYPLEKDLHKVAKMSLRYATYIS